MFLKDYLKEKKMTKQDFARSIGFSTAAVVQWCHSNRYPKPEALVQIYNETDGQVTPNDFLQQIQK